MVVSGLIVKPPITTYKWDVRGGLLGPSQILFCTWLPTQQYLKKEKQALFLCVVEERQEAQNCRDHLTTSLRIKLTHVRWQSQENWRGRDGACPTSCQWHSFIPLLAKPVWIGFSVTCSQKTFWFWEAAKNSYFTYELIVWHSFTEQGSPVPEFTQACKQVTIPPAF